jgi:CBS domain-containing protein
MKVRDIMVQPVVIVREDTTLEEVARLMLANGIGGVPVVDAQGKLCGIVTESDFTGRERCIPFSAYRVPQLFGEWVSREGIERIYAAGRKLTAGEIMHSPVVTVTEDEAVTVLVDRLLRHNITRIPVVRDGVPVGMVARHDLLKLLLCDESTR